MSVIMFRGRRLAGLERKEKDIPNNGAENNEKYRGGKKKEAAAAGGRRIVMDGSRVFFKPPRRGLGRRRSGRKINESAVEKSLK